MVVKVQANGWKMPELGWTLTRGFDQMDAVTSNAQQMELGHYSKDILILVILKIKGKSS